MNSARRECLDSACEGARTWRRRGQKSTASREIGQVMQWPPPRPRPSSAPTISTPSMRSSSLVWVFRSHPVDHIWPIA